MALSTAQSRPLKTASVVLFLVLLWLAHALGYFAHEYAHSFTAWAFDYKANPLGLNYGHLDWNNVLTQDDIDENVDYDPIFAAGRGSIASLIAIAGVLFGNGFSYLLSLYGYKRAKRASRSILAMFFFLLGVMNAGNLISYIPARTFATHADMATVEHGLHISPWWLALALGVPFCIAVAHFVLRMVPEAMLYFFPQSRGKQALLLAFCCYLIFVFYGGAGLHRYGNISHAISLVSIWLLLPLAVIYDWLHASQIHMSKHQP
jgi:hypothetical protein